MKWISQNYPIFHSLAKCLETLPLFPPLYSPLDIPTQPEGLRNPHCNVNGHLPFSFLWLHLSEAIKIHPCAGYYFTLTVCLKNLQLAPDFYHNRLLCGIFFQMCWQMFLPVLCSHSLHVVALGDASASFRSHSWTSFQIPDSCSHPHPLTMHQRLPVQRMQHATPVTWQIHDSWKPVFPRKRKLGNIISQGARWQLLPVTAFLKLLRTCGTH